MSSSKPSKSAVFKVLNDVAVRVDGSLMWWASDLGRASGLKRVLRSKGHGLKKGSGLISRIVRSLDRGSMLDRPEFSKFDNGDILIGLPAMDTALSQIAAEERAYNFRFVCEFMEKQKRRAGGVPISIKPTEEHPIEYNGGHRSVEPVLYGTYNDGTRKHDINFADFNGERMVLAYPLVSVFSEARIPNAGRIITKLQGKSPETVVSCKMPTKIDNRVPVVHWLTREGVNQLFAMFNDKFPDDVAELSPFLDEMWEYDQFADTEEADTEEADTEEADTEEGGLAALSDRIDDLSAVIRLFLRTKG
jgi:hypothetical protein